MGYRADVDGCNSLPGYQSRHRSWIEAVFIPHPHTWALERDEPVNDPWSSASPAFSDLKTTSLIQAPLIAEC
jgi:hypothetical protein